MCAGTGRICRVSVGRNVSLQLHEAHVTLTEGVEQS